MFAASVFSDIDFNIIISSDLLDIFSSKFSSAPDYEKQLANYFKE